MIDQLLYKDDISFTFFSFFSFHFNVNMSHWTKHKSILFTPIFRVRDSWRRESGLPS